MDNKDMKIVNITNHQENASQNQAHIASHPSYTTGFNDIKCEYFLLFSKTPKAEEKETL